MPDKKIIVMTHAGGSPHHGPNMRWYFLARALEPLGIRVEIVAASYFHKYHRPPTVKQAVQREVVDGVEYHWIRTPGYASSGLRRMRNQLAFVHGCYRYADELARRAPDLVIASSPPPFVSFPAAAVARRAGAAFVFEVRDLWPELLLALGRFSRWHPYIIALRVAEAYGVRRAERIVSVKPGEHEYFEQRYGVASERCSYIPNGFLPGGEADDAPSSLEEIRSHYRFIVGYVGALSEWYGLADLLALARRFQERDDVAFVLIGKGELRASLAGQAGRGDLRHLHVLDPVERNRVQACLARCDVCYVGMKDMALNRYGISSNKIFEYMYAGRPILACYSVGYDPVKAAGCGLTVPPGDPAALAHALSHLLSDVDLRRAYGARGREYFDRNHRFDAVAQKVWVEVLEGTPA